MSAILLFFLGAVVLPLLLAEFRDCGRWLAERIVRWAAGTLGDASERYREEVLASLNEMPGKLLPLLEAVWFAVCVPWLRWTLRKRSGLGLDQDLPDPIAFVWNVPTVYKRHDVTAIVIAHDGARWVGRVLDALAEQERPLNRIVAVDVGSRDATRKILVKKLGAERVITRPRQATFGQSVAYASRAVFAKQQARQITGDADEPVEWLWILHDDCEPATDALRYLLAAADRNPGAAVVGPKVLGWYNSSELVDIGFTVASSGRKEMGFDRGDIDQGQHDGLRSRFAVSSAGMLIRRDVWDALGGFDSAVQFVHDDLDFCWRVNLAGWQVLFTSDAVVYHVQALTTGRRRLDPKLPSFAVLDRHNAFFAVLANVQLAYLPLTFLRIAFGVIFRGISYMLVLHPRYAVDELLALTLTFVRLPRILRARINRRSRRVAIRLNHTALHPRHFYFRRLSLFDLPWQEVVRLYLWRVYP